jgi:hypothetical protein
MHSSPAVVGTDGLPARLARQKGLSCQRLPDSFVPSRSQVP